MAVRPGRSRQYKSVDVTCHHCQVQFQIEEWQYKRSESKRFFCSPEHSRIGRAGTKYQNEKVGMVCKTCNKDYQTQPRHAHIGECQDCRREHYFKKIDMICAECKEPYRTQPRYAHLGKCSLCLEEDRHRRMRDKKGEKRVVKLPILGLLRVKWSCESQI